ncbi:hypothetical protein KTAU_07850 [Thermogemmatispora aurantia]|jgi:hypothetical protein|uniref:HAMP domain-containing protein n=1 Tax=Thermogemmatispora aurantia TaxID=2045279 RepID=A0A5J4K666_9CHLR|nr:hypothetical protein [Thermogemmatispora aurantia]GER82147.1 hypothetical protein KTAU_07850 [Thermogemmatispora aurantia]
MLADRSLELQTGYEARQDPWPEASLDLATLLRRTGFGIKLRFLISMIIVSFIPVSLFVLLFYGSIYRLAGRNTWLLLCGILLLTVLTATWVFLPIVRPIRRATRRITATTDEVRRLTVDAQRIAEEQQIGTSILAAVSRHLAVRHTAIVRDIALITRTCQSLQPRLVFLHQRAQANRDSETLEALMALRHGLQQISFLSARIADAYERDRLPEQLDKAMKSAQEIATQFRDTSQQLARDLEQLELATEALI